MVPPSALGLNSDDPHRDKPGRGHMQITGCRELESNEGPWQQDAGQNGVL